MKRALYVLLLAIIYWYVAGFSLLLLHSPAVVYQPSGEAPKPARETAKIFISGTSAGDAETLNWILAADSASLSYVGHTVDSLVTYDNEWRVRLRTAARDVEVSEDGLTYTVAIRDDLRWSDGSQVTAEDYVYTLQNLMFSDWLNYPYKSDWQEEVGGKTVFVTPQVVDETTFAITRQSVYPEFIYTVRTLIPYPKYIAVKYGGDVEAFTQAPEFNNLTYTGNLGPYKFKEWLRNDKFVVERNPDYYLGRDTGAPYFDQYIVKLFGTSATAHAALEAGNITYGGIDPAKVSIFRKMEGINVYTVPTTGYLFLAYNLRNNGWGGLKKKEVRQALSLAVSKKLIIEHVLYGFGEPAFSFIPKVSPWYADEGVAQYGVEPLLDEEEAKALLLNAGYDEPVTLTLVTNVGNEERENIGYLVKEQLSAVGIEVELKFVPWATLLRNYLMNKTPGTDEEPRYNNGAEAISEEPWDLMVMGFSGSGIALSPSGQSLILGSDGGLNFFGYSNPQVDELFSRAKSAEALDEGARQELYAELARLIAEEQPVNFLVFQLANVGFQKNVRGIEPGINMGYNYHLWYFE
jgi:peptide/nickel transport system substrate-binding protein